MKEDWSPRLPKAGDVFQVATVRGSLRYVLIDGDMIGTSAQHPNTMGWDTVVYQMTLAEPAGRSFDDLINEYHITGVLLP